MISQRGADIRRKYWRAWKTSAKELQDWRGGQQQQKELGNVTEVRVRAKVQIYRESRGCGDLGWSLMSLEGQVREERNL